MSEGRLTGLALLHIHRDIPVSAQAVIKRFAKTKKTLSSLSETLRNLFTTAAIRLLLMLAIALFANVLFVFICVPHSRQIRLLFTAAKSYTV